MLSLLNDSDARSKSLLSRLADQPKSPAIIGIAEVLCEQGRYSEAITRLLNVAAFYGDVYRFNLVLARAYRDNGETELAKQYYEKACQIAPQNEVAMKELIALTAFPHAVPKPSPRERAMERKVAPTLVAPASKETEAQASEPETPSVFKLDRDKLSKVLGGVVGSPEKSDAPPIEAQKPSSSKPADASSVVEAFRKADNLLEQEPDIDALAREMMGNTFQPQEPMNTSQSDELISDKMSQPPVKTAPIREAQAQPPKIAAPTQQGVESEADIDAIARQMLGIGVSDEPIESASTTTSESEPVMPASAPSSTSSAPKPIPLDENGNPIIKIDRNKLTQALSGIYRAKGIAPSAAESDAGEDDDMPFPMPAKSDGGRLPTPSPLASPQSPAQSEGALSFEEEIMAMQMQGGDVDAFIANKDTAHRDEANDAMPAPSPSLNDEYDIDALAREMMNAQMPKVEETNDPTPVAEQRQPFSDDDIKTPTRQLAKIFQSQGAYAKAVKVYEMLAEREPENASLYDILISELREKMNTSR
ncbi:MAG: tetratricopeptide repeat protein [Chloroherpetonaceae bacterium]